MPKSSSIASLIAVAVVSLLSAGVRSAVQTSTDEERMEKLDAGPKTIDVTTYPPEQQRAYKLFGDKCSSCHVLARGINSEMVLPDEWERYIRRMMNKPNSGIGSEQGKTLYRFLVYDASVRKSDFLKRRIAELPAAERAAVVEKIQAINPSFARS